MTTPKEALEFKPCPFCGGRDIEAVDSLNFVACQNCGASLEDSEPSARELWNTRAASIQGEDAVERVAHAVTSEFGRMYKDGVPICMREGETTWRTYYAGFDLSQFAQRITDVILATGLVPDEAAIRADEREKCERRVEELDCLYINDERCPFGGIPADPETSIRREAIKECLAAIRSGGGE